MVQFSGVIEPFMKVQEGLIQKELRKRKLSRKELLNTPDYVDSKDVWHFVKNSTHCTQGCKRMLDQVINNFDDSLNSKI